MEVSVPEVSWMAVALRMLMMSVGVVRLAVMSVVVVEADAEMVPELMIEDNLALGAT